MIQLVSIPFSLSRIIQAIYTANVVWYLSKPLLAGNLIFKLDESTSISSQLK